MIKLKNIIPYVIMIVIIALGAYAYTSMRTTQNDNVVIQSACTSADQCLYKAGYDAMCIMGQCTYKQPEPEQNKKHEKK